jgi:hypothetical protein
VTDKLITYDPPGAIGLIDREATVHLRFDETLTATRPRDARGNLIDLDIRASTNPVVMPPVVNAVLGRGRSFNGTSQGLGATDLVSGSTLHTRDMTIQAVLAWTPSTAFGPGFVICRGLGSLTAQFCAYGLRIDPVDVPSSRALVRWFWQDTAGIDRIQTGAQVTLLANQFTLITATRRWVSPTQVELNYYVGDTLIGSVTSAIGSIGGGTTGTTTIGYRTIAGINGLFFSGIIDELMVIPRELCLEEIAATWRRITVDQPRGNQLFLEQFDDGFPMSDDPASDVQLDIRMTGHGLGLASSAIETLRENFLPQRAYGTTLQQWEAATRATLSPALSIQQRRQRVLARFQQRNGVSQQGIRDALGILLDCDPSLLQFITYSQVVTDDFSAALLNTMIWDTYNTPAPAINPVAGQLIMGTLTGLGLFLPDGWRTFSLSVSQPVALLDEVLTLGSGANGQEQFQMKVQLTGSSLGFEAGIWIGNRGKRNYAVLGFRQSAAATWQLRFEVYVDRVLISSSLLQTFVSMPPAHWLRINQIPDSAVQASWGTVGPTGPFNTSAFISFPPAIHWAGGYGRCVESIATFISGCSAAFDDAELWTPNGTRPFYAYVYRDPAIPGNPDIEGANAVLQDFKHGYTHAAVITSKALLINDPAKGKTDRGPMGAP